jgi:glutamate-1-semialdehyde aminotransferase
VTSSAALPLVPRVYGVTPHLSTFGKALDNGFAGRWPAAVT